MSEWTTPPQSVEYRAPATGLGVLRKALEALARRISALEGSAPLKQAGVRGRPGLLASLDFDGDGTDTDLGTAGWMLGNGGGGPSLLALNGIDVYADLAAKDVTLAAQDATILGLIDDLAAKDVLLTELIASVITPDSGVATANTFAIPAGQANRVTRASFTLTVPDGCTSALVLATAGSSGWNAGGSTDYLYSYLEIGPTPAWSVRGSPTCPNGTATNSDVIRNVLIEGLSGGDPIVFSIQPYTIVNTWPSVDTNSVTVSATCLFMR